MKLPRLPDRRFVYVLNVSPRNSLIPFLWIGKVGFSVDADVRAADIERSIWQTTGMQVRVRRLFRVRVFMYRAIEAAIHTVIRPYRSSRFEGASGGTEFFRVFNLVSGLLCYCLFYAYSLPCAGWLALCVMVLPWPVDFVLFVLILAAVEYALYCVAIYAAYVGGIALIGSIS